MKGLFAMKIQLPDGKKILLKDNISLEEKMEIVEQLVDEWRDVIKEDRRTWFSNVVKYFLDSLASYLVWHKDENNKGKHDKEVITLRRAKKLKNKKDNNIEVYFADLSDIQKDKLGIED